MKTIKVFLASSDELEMERLQFDSLFNHLNRIFRPRGLYLELSKWEYLDSSMGPKHKQEEYNEELKTCEMCMVMYWTKFGEYTGEELMTAYEELKEGRNPKKLYVFFKEPGDVTPELKSFKESFATEFGHFYCKFENVDSMRLQFLLQLETYQTSEMKDLVKVEDSKVKVDGKDMVDLDNIPFAAKNRRYRELKNDIEKIESEIRTFEGILAAGPNEAISDLLGKKRSERYYKKEELSEHESFLFDTAQRIARQQGDRISERMSRAIQAFEDGRASDANAILEEALHDARELRKEIARTKDILKQQQESAAVSISELLLKTSVTLADDSRPVDDRVKETHEIYQEAYALANESDYDREKHMDLLSKYGEFLKTYAKYEDCLRVRTELLELVSSVFGESHPDVASSYNNIGFVYGATGDYSKALEYYEKSLKIRLSVLGENHPDVATSYNNIGSVYDDMGDYSKALEYYEKSLRIRLSVLGENHPDVASSYNNIGFVYGATGDYSKALEYYEKDLKIGLSVLGENHPDVASSYNNIGSVYYNMGDYSKALEYLEKSLRIWLPILGENHPDVATNYNNIGSVYYKMSDYSKVLEYIEKSLKILLSVLGENHPDVATNYNNIGLVYKQMGDYSKALEYLEKSLNIRLSVLGENHPDVALSYNNIGSVYKQMGDYSKALEYYEKSLRISLTVFDEDHPKTKDVQENIEEVRQKLMESSGSSSGGFSLSKLFKKKK